MICRTVRRCVPLGSRVRPVLQTRGVRGLHGAAAAGVAEGDKKVKTIEDLPGPSTLTDLYWFFIRGYLLRTHELQLIYKKRFGSLWKSRNGQSQQVNIADPAILEVVLRQEGKYPMRTEIDHWRLHRELRKLSCGPFTEQGEKWHALRTILNHRMLKPKEAKTYVGSINEVITDFMARLQDLRQQSPDGHTVTDMANELYRFAFEGVSFIVFETRIGCLEKTIPAETQKFIDSIGQMFRSLVYVAYLPPWMRPFLPYWERYLEAWDNVFDFGKKLVDKKMSEIQTRLERGEEVQGEYLTYLLSSGKLSVDEVYGSVCELLLAGVDTTSNTLCWSLYHLARDPQLQQTLYHEMMESVPPDQVPGADDITHMPLLRAVIKETLRLYPVVPTNARYVTEKEVVMGDYVIPKNTLFVLNHYAISRDEANFKDPERFYPQRWLRGPPMTHHPFSSIPFGYGLRACVGKRIAQLEMHLALFRIIRMFEVKPDVKAENVRSMSRIVLTPSKKLNLRFMERTSV